MSDHAQGQPDAGAHPFFVAAQFHPELTSRPLTPHPMFMGLCAAAIARRTALGPHPGMPDTPKEVGPVVRRWLRTPNKRAQPA